MADNKKDKELDLTKLLDDVLDTYDTDIDEVSEESTQEFSELPDGYYLSGVEEAGLNTSKNSGKLMASFKYKIVEDGIAPEEDDTFVEIPKTKNRYIFKHYVLQDDDVTKQKAKIDKLISDIKKFEAEPGVPLVQPLLDELKAGNITKSEFIMSSLEFLNGMQVWINANTKEKDGQRNTWYTLISWARARVLGIEPSEE